MEAGRGLRAERVSRSYSPGVLDCAKVVNFDFHGFLKGKLAVKLLKSYPGLRKKPYWGNKFWARGYFINTVGMNEDSIRRYVKHQEEKEKEEERNRQDFLFES